MAVDLALAGEHIPLVFSRLDERQRRWVAGLLSEIVGHGGTKQVAELASIDPKTVRQGRIDLAGNLEDYPDARIRRPGGGRPPIEKKLPTSGSSSKRSSNQKPAVILKGRPDTRAAACERSPDG